MKGFINRLIAFLCASCFGLSCATFSPPTVYHSAEFPVTIEIKRGAVAKIDDISILFVGVPRDGRCPVAKSGMPVSCTWAGIAEAVLRLSGAGSREVVLNTNPNYQKSYQYDIYHITLVNLKPHPILHQTTKQSSYTAVLSIDVRK